MAAVVGYLLGSIPTGMIVARVYRNVDLTAYGSGRTGATNVLRTLGSGAAAIAFAGDFLKGLLAVAVVQYVIAGNPRLPWLELIAAIAAVLGHSYSMFIGFKGGRGVVTGFGATIVAAPVPMLIALVVGAVCIAPRATCRWAASSAAHSPAYCCASRPCSRVSQRGRCGVCSSVVHRRRPPRQHRATARRHRTQAGRTRL